MKSGNRTIEQLKEHYAIEKELANRLRNASRQERLYLYSSLYDEMLKRVPLHSLLIRKSSSQETDLAASEQITFIKRFLNNDITFLEVGPGDCALSLEVAKIVRQVYAIDVSAALTKSVTQPPNFHLVLSDGSSVDLPRNTVGVAYSNQLMEHLHPDDACAQLKNIYHTLVPGGVYICITPNRLNGPHDISKHFDEVATCFHLKEYTTLELSSMFRRVGFSRLRVYIGARGKFIGLPTFPIVLFEMLLDKLPYAVRKTIARTRFSRLLLGIRIVGMK